MRVRKIRERILIVLLLLGIPFMECKAASDDSAQNSDSSYARRFIEGELFDQSYYYDTGILPGENEDSEEGTGEDSGTSADASCSDTEESGASQEASTADEQVEGTSDAEGSAVDGQENAEAGAAEDAEEDGEDSSGQEPSDNGLSEEADVVIIDEDAAENEYKNENESDTASEEDVSADWQGLLPGGLLPAEGDDSWCERSVVGATGWNTVELTLKAEASSSATSVGAIAAGTAFCIDEETGDWWRVVLSDGGTGYIEHCYCMINLPDVLPAMEYDIKNAYSAIYRSCSYDIDGVTGEKLYSAGTSDTDGQVWNERLGRYEYLVPVMYSTAKKNINCAVQCIYAYGRTVYAENLRFLSPTFRYD